MAHDMAINATSHLPENQKVATGRINEGNLDFAAWEMAEIVKQLQEGKDIFPKLADFFLKMAYNYHIFVDANKRTTYTLIKIILYADKFHLKTNYAKDYHFIVEVAAGLKTREEIEAWLRQKSEQLREDVNISIEDELKEAI